MFNVSIRHCYLLIAAIFLSSCHQFVVSKDYYELDAAQSSNAEQALTSLGYELINGQSNPKLYSKYNDMVSLQQIDGNQVRLYIRDTSEQADVMAAMSGTGVELVTDNTDMCQQIAHERVVFSRRGSRGGAQDMQRAFKKARTFFLEHEYIAPYGIHDNELFLGSLGGDCRLMNSVKVLKQGQEISAIYTVFADRSQNLSQQANAYKAEKQAYIDFMQQGFIYFDHYTQTLKK